MNADAQHEGKRRGCSRPLAGCAIGCGLALVVAVLVALWIPKQLPRWFAEAALDPQVWSGPALAPIGDIDGDGEEDLAVGAFTRDRVWILSSATGRVLEEVRGPRDFGFALAAIEDADGDGQRDLVVGAPRSREVRVLGSRNLHVVARFESSESGLFGHAVAAAGDLDGDGVPEVAIGDPGRSTDGWLGPGSVSVHSLDGREHRKLRGPSERSGFGSRLTSLPASELAVFDFGDSSGSLTVVSLATGSTQRIESGKWPEPEPRRAPRRSKSKKKRSQPPYAPSVLGWLPVGDVDGDGRIDAASVVGHSFDTVVALVLESGASETELWRIDGSKGERFGRVLAAPGDLDGDGVSDVVVSDPGTIKGGGLPMMPLPRAMAARMIVPDSDPTRGGVIHAFSGRDGSVLWEARGDAEWDWLGIDVLPLNDVDGDGVADLAAAGERGFVEKAPFVRVISGRTGDVVWEQDF